MRITHRGQGNVPINRSDTCLHSNQTKIYGILQNRGRSYMQHLWSNGAGGGGIWAKGTIS